MSTSISSLSELPAEILEHVLLYLPGQDIIKMETVCVVAKNKLPASDFDFCG
jgi:hypothetical protein